jgi:alpha-N-arabinofuranosidase
MPFKSSRKFPVLLALVAASAVGLLSSLSFADPGSLTISADKPGAKYDPMLYGLMTEEINFSYEGGLYAELIQNRIFKNRPAAPGRGRGNRGAASAPASAPVDPRAFTIPCWSVVNSDGAKGAISLDSENPVNQTALTTSLKLEIADVAAGQRIGVANYGFWGIPVRPNTTYTASFYAKAGAGFNGPLNVAIESKDGKTTYATGKVDALSGEFKKYTLTLKTGEVKQTADAVFTITGGAKGTVWFNLVSLFPPTFKNRPNGLRPDLMQMLADMKPHFLRFPGGNYLEGNDKANRFDWKKTVGPIEDRPGHMSPWGYRATDGLGVLEFCQWAEDVGSEPLLGIFAGFTLGGVGRNNQGVNATGEDLKPYIEEGLEEIEYIIGDPNTTKWGAQRAKDGHPAPFKLQYVEIGNEDWIDAGGKRTYNERFTAFAKAIRAKYPQLKIIGTMRSNESNFTYETRPDLVDDHFYVDVRGAISTPNRYDTYDRSKPKVFVGEWATNNGVGTPTCNLDGGLGDAAFLVGLERNPDVIPIHCYAPLLVNVNPGGQQWQTNLIGYNAIDSYGSPSYYVQKMFSNNQGTAVLPTKLGEGAQNLFAISAVDEPTGDIIIKFVNRRDAAVQMTIDLSGVASVKGGTLESMAGSGLKETNSINDLKKIVPVAKNVTISTPKFAQEFPAYSANVLRIKTK